MLNVSVANTRTDSVGIAHAMQVGMTQAINIGQTKMETIGQAHTHTVGQQMVVNVGQQMQINVGQVFQIIVGGGGATAGFGDGDPREGSREIHDGIIVSEAMDWCKKDGAIVPYRLWAKQIQAGNLANSVRQTDDRSHVAGSIVLVSHGDAPGASGINSGTNNAECTPKTWSETVRAENRNMVRHDDL